MTLVSAGVLQAAFQASDTPTSSDFKNLLDSFEHSLSASATSDKVDRLGVGAVGKTVFTAGTTASAQNVIGAAALGRELFGAAATASAQGHLGAGAVGTELLESGTTASAQGHLGGGTVGIGIFEATTTASINSLIAGVDKATTAQVADPAVSASAAYIAPDKMRYSPFGVRAYVTFNSAGTVLESQRVSSVTHEAAGKFKIRWAPALPTADAALAMGTYGSSNTNTTVIYVDTSSKATVSALDVNIANEADTEADPNDSAFVTVFCSGV